jgi:hypothetical protein
MDLRLMDYEYGVDTYVIIGLVHDGDEALRFDACMDVSLRVKYS